MGKFVIRIGWCGFAIACALFLVSQWMAHPAWLNSLETVFWPASILPASGHAAARRPGAGEIFAVGFSALMNGAFYAGLAWLVWWAARLAGIAKRAPGAKARFISFFLALGVIFSLLVALAEAVIQGPKLARDGWGGLGAAYLMAANLLALIVLTGASSGWALWWLRDFLARRNVARARRG